MTAAERTRRWRERQRAGVQLVTVELTADDLDAFRELHLLSSFDEDDSPAVPAAVRFALSDYLGTVTRHATGCADGADSSHD